MPPLRALFVNSGILGHASVARLIREAAARDESLTAEHLDLSADLTPRERIIRRVMCVGPAPGSAAGALTGARLRHELHAGVLAARRIRAREVAGAGWDVMHFHTQAAAYASLRRMRRTPSVVSIDITQRLASAEVPAGIARMDYAPNAAWDRAVFRASSAVIATSRWAADDVIRAQPALASRVHVMPYPVPLDGFDAGWTAERAARPANAAVRVLFIGGDWVRKGGPELLDAWRAGGFAERAVLDLVTDWPGVSALDAGGVRVHRGVRAYTPEWFQRWRDADVFVMPTRGEAFGMVYQEAAAAGLPAIGTRINAIPELVQHAATGLLVDPEDGRALVQSLDRLIGDAALRQRLGTAARARIQRVGSMETYASRLSAILHEAAKQVPESASADAKG
ncbi:glycosyltransferase family 4 protein [Longimicrobium terrae]|uniref:Glycosyltransferase involved in cell wall biosynthesis n=1 Tax=Longimicrobium terrae TaxID=1639882 RepID=A0A841GL82_9BACT|nr:glycosyltransferase family 4 protein [Longimicrobium terrae]MBB4634963.1 glycosyltransferase involved in cell wall biosynthesis [Longimicrobium terrae]MBB6069357.1 glycosyltransferase involved in cell wall biosynthesis [Longimicrobium terrae]NNC31835.1 glycosyltransferase family 4 protein [Longimicrobium terrae]